MYKPVMIPPYGINVHAYIFSLGPAPVNLLFSGLCPFSYIHEHNYSCYG